MKLTATIIMLLKQFLLTFMAFLLPIKGVLIAVGVSIVADTVLGLFRAYKNKKRITSRKLSKVVSKMFLYQGSIILFFIIDKFILGDIIGMFTSLSHVMTKLIAITLISIELKSMNENFESVYGVSLWFKFKELLSRAKEIKDDFDGIGLKKESTIVIDNPDSPDVDKLNSPD